jgi:Cu(I)-responsive transcriptional regulator
MLIGKLAKTVNASIDTIRYYEREGLIEPSRVRASGYREFNERSVEHLKFILRAKKLGFSLKQIKDLLMLKESPDTTCMDVRSLAEQKLDQVKAKISALRQMEKQLKQLVDACRNTGEEDCPIMTNLKEGDTA